MAAKIHEGVYLIGRDKLCQIRPKSRSVSRMHCAIFNDSETLRVLDLRSTSGTRVNGEKIPPRTRVQLHDGDQLRCGKVTFSVSLDIGAKVEAGDSAVGLLRHDYVSEDDEHTTFTGPALQETDIADLLVNLDEVERADRIATIRHRHEEEEKKAAEQSEAVLADEDFETDPQEQVDEPADSHGGHHPAEPNLPESQRYKKLDQKTRRSIASRLKRKTDNGFDAQKLAILIACSAIAVILFWAVWTNYEMFFGPEMQIKDLD